MSHYHLSPEAKADLFAHEANTFANFGYRVADELIEAFSDAFEKLADHPEAGHVREELSPRDTKIRFWTIKRRFLIVYRSAPHGIDVVRIFDGNEDVRTKLALE